MHGLASLVLDNLRKVGAPDMPAYREMLAHCTEVAPPPFAENSFGRRYFELAVRPDWFANSLVANAALEGYGSTQIWKFSNRVGNAAYADAVRRHAFDESRHSTMFVRMLHLTFPGAAIDNATEETLFKIQPRLTPTNHPPIGVVSQSDLYEPEPLLEELIAVHLTEIRALVLQFLLRAVLRAYSPRRSRKKLDACTSVLIRDEARHIEYVARILEAESADGRRDFLIAACERQMRVFNDLTLMELERESVVI